MNGISCQRLTPQSEHFCRVAKNQDASIYDRLFGGRTNAMKLYHKVEGDEKLRYYDFTSLYPAVNAKKQYPVGHPQIIYSYFDTLDSYFGFVKCTVLAPRDLYHPVLPYRCHGKLMFPLCCACVTELN